MPQGVLPAFIWVVLYPDTLSAKAMGFDAPEGTGGLRHFISKDIFLILFCSEYLHRYVLKCIFKGKSSQKEQQGSFLAPITICHSVVSVGWLSS